MADARTRMLQDLRVRNYSPRTVQTYLSQVDRFARHFRRPLTRLSPKDVRSFLVFMVEKKKASPSLLKQISAALRFLYRITLERDWPSSTFPFPRQPRKVPYIMSRSQIVDLISAVSNLKHRVILMALYATGARIAELATLRVEDIQSQRMVILLQGKGQKQRIVPLSPVLLDSLREYWRTYRPPKPWLWLFPGQTSRGHLDRSSIARIVDRARRSAGLPKGISAHTLRHCFATHHLENGVHLRAIQELLGHTSIRTTMIYTHVASKTLLSIKSPLDLLPEIPGSVSQTEPPPESP